MRYSATAPVKIVVIGAGGTGGYLIPQTRKELCETDRKAYPV